MEDKILKPNEVDPNLLKRLEKKYGSIDMENDFFTNNLNRYYKTSNINQSTGKVTHDVINLASFGDSLKKLSQALSAIKSLSKTSEGEMDNTIQDIAQQTRDIFNQYRTHIRKNYPDQYSTLKNFLQEISTSAAGGGYTTPFAFNPNKKAKGAKNIYYYKLGFKPVNIEKLRKQIKSIDHVDLSK
jgi:hypothetical protein